MVSKNAEWLAAKAHLALSEDARSSLTQVNLGRFLFPRRQRRHYSYESMVDTKSILITLSYHPCLLRERKVLMAISKKSRGLASMTVKDLPKPNRLPSHLRRDMVALWLEWSATTGTKNIKDAQRKPCRSALIRPLFIEWKAC